MKKENKKENKEKEILYFGKTKEELLKKYKYIYSMEKFFNKKVLKVKLLNNNMAYLDKDLNIICEYKYIYGMTKLFNKDVLVVEFSNDNMTYLNKNFKK